MGVRVEANPAAVRSFAIAVAEKDLRVRANRVLNAARTHAPVDQGHLRASLAVEFVTVDRQPVARVGSNLPYAVFVHEGTGLYGPKHQRIYPKKGKAMVWPARNNSYRTTGGNRRYSGGKTQAYVGARWTRGMKPRPFLVQALHSAFRS